MHLYLLLLTKIIAQLEQTLYDNDAAEFREVISELINKCDFIYQKIFPLLPRSPEKYLLFESILLKPKFWYNNVKFSSSSLQDLGIYKNWTVDFILSDRRAEFNGTSTDVCFEEILRQTYKNSEFKECTISPLCQNIVFGDRNDTGYLLTHKLLYLQIARQSKCMMGSSLLEYNVRIFCSQIWREAKTNEYLGYPQHDIFLEQIVLCGMEGYEEFFIQRWKRKPIQWQTVHGCYVANEVPQVQRRNTNVIEFGCADHTTGLGAAALAINLRYVM